MRMMRYLIIYRFSTRLVLRFWTGKTLDEFTTSCLDHVTIYKLSNSKHTAVVVARF